MHISLQAGYNSTARNRQRLCYNHGLQGNKVQIYWQGPVHSSQSETHMYDRLPRIQPKTLEHLLVEALYQHEKIKRVTASLLLTCTAIIDVSRTCEGCLKSNQDRSLRFTK